VNDRLCLIPARGGSQRIPRKNLTLFNGLPLVAHAIRVAQASDLFDDVFVSTDDAEIADVARSHGAIVPYLRPPELSSASASLVDVSLHLAEYFRSRQRSFQELCLLMPTSPLREVEDITRSYARFQSVGGGFLMSVTRYVMGSPFWALRMEPAGCVEPIFGLEHFTDAHDRSFIFCPSGVVRWVSIEDLSRERTFYGRGVVGYEVPPYRAIEIDDPHDMCLAEALLASNERRLRENYSQ
jgi:CMP-N-acetylneuraminic acid synthetase